MKRYLLTYTVDDYPGCGGGDEREYFDTEEQMHARAQELLTSEHENGDKTGPRYVGVCGEKICTTYEYKPVEVVKKWAPVAKDI